MDMKFVTVLVVLAVTVSQTSETCKLGKLTRISGSWDQRECFAARVIYCQWRKTKIESSFKNWMSIRPQDKQDGLQPVLRKLVHVISKKEDPENYKLVNLISAHGKTMKKIIQESISQDLKDKMVIRSGQHGFVKGTSCLTNLIAISNNDLQGLIMREEA
ncbi:hypothetical protein DUI87_06630 [Hirundo rustica rustica]|uniref:Reverse transcriptase domain-containing protein n=1 Tax=Hirundo rustica rustica TaxID=333673 RepID=A0A3M0KVG5_HIRRU|nr:hypothetical protein DUI87_06630 [Hirundo rustica rustica]